MWSYEIEAGMRYTSSVLPRRKLSATYVSIPNRGGSNFPERDRPPSRYHSSGKRLLIR